MEVAYFYKFDTLAQSPHKCSHLAAGYDLFSCEHVVIPAGSRVAVSTGIGLLLPPGCYGRIAPRSGLSLRECIDVAGGVVDRDFRGAIMVILVNNSKKPYEVNLGDRIAQLICEQIVSPTFMEVEELPQSTRGTSGFGSTGK